MRNDITRKFAILLLPLIALAATGPAQAENRNIEFDAVEEKNLKNGKFLFDESKGYIFLHGNSRQWGVFIKEPGQENIAAYEAEWTEQFEKAKSKYVRELKRWEDLTESRASRPGKKPVEPTAETFSIGPIELWNSVSFGPQFVFSKDKSDKENPVFSYMIEVEPGNYNYFGPVLSVPGAATTGVCYCMGSVKFSVSAGQITDLGNFLTNAPALDNGGTALLGPMLLQENSPDSKALRWLKLPVKFGLPDSLSSYPAARAEFAPSGKLNNVYRAMVSRMGPVEGLFRYERDQVIDIKAEEEAARVAAAEAALAASPAPESAAEAEVTEADTIVSDAVVE